MATDIGTKTLTFTFTVDQTNSILNVLGQAPFVQSANLINLIQAQGTDQFVKIQAEVDAEEAAELVEAPTDE